ncbi:DUF5789 family protein [Candidatus Halobonum tyrrellensis]|uniref:Uncharacterized protein n=1 Tax=Candidatus Halobonum tyrrellensis G22 TaxID=1324957 RepID=V4IXL2_9EURY|nr:hypothetical protein [Candidatus Halobonum tyrrellensis]ESP87897.1 hypothetical protein K933_11291 [Candidatus Halobonum tyrrellensis G22]
MPDDKQGREDQARTAERRRLEREIAEELERADEPEPPVDAADLAAVEADLDAVSFPATGTEVVAAVGDRAVETPDGSHTVAELLPDADGETFDSPAAVRARVQRPTVAGAMKRVVEAVGRPPNTAPRESQWEAYERTFRELEAIDEDDDDEGIRVVADWIVERARETGTPPGSRDVRRRAAKFCRSNGYTVRDDEWLGV